MDGRRNGRDSSVGARLAERLLRPEQATEGLTRPVLGRTPPVEDVSIEDVPTEEVEEVSDLRRRARRDADRRRTAPAQAPEGAAPPAGRGLQRLLGSRRALRQAILLQEILGPPKALRRTG
ncbi:MAG: hypothetical protein ACRDJN_27560 [Chloroflexota bacterium]